MEVRQCPPQCSALQCAEVSVATGAATRLADECCQSSGKATIPAAALKVTKCYGETSDLWRKTWYRGLAAEGVVSVQRHRLVGTTVSISAITPFHEESSLWVRRHTAQIGRLRPTTMSMPIMPIHRRLAGGSGHTISRFAMPLGLWWRPTLWSWR
jgi:hypothetical protein